MKKSQNNSEHIIRQESDTLSSEANPPLTPTGDGGVHAPGDSFQQCFLFGSLDAKHLSINSHCLKQLLQGGGRCSLQTQ